MIWVGKITSVAAVAVLLALMLAACSEASSSFGRPYRGRSLDVSIVDLQRLPVLQYSNEYGEGSVSHHRVVPSEQGMELVLIRLQVANYTATNHLLTIDRQGAELRDFGQGKYLPLDVEDQGQSWSRFEEGWGLGRQRQFAGFPHRSGELLKTRPAQLGSTGCQEDRVDRWDSSPGRGLSDRGL